MITTCTVCQARYQLDDEKIPARVIKVRCPACSGVFSLDGTQVQRDQAVVTTGYESAAAAPQAAPPTPVPAATAPAPPAPPAAAVEPASSGVAVMDAPAPSPSQSPSQNQSQTQSGGRRKRTKEEMLARALVSDIKVYNRELYDTAKSEGNLLEALGAEIKKSWELYKEKVTPEVANGTDHFRNALNEILADGEKVF